MKRIQNPTEKIDKTQAFKFSERIMKRLLKNKKSCNGVTNVYV